jgi:non-ribosomal peptide synthetase component F
VALGSTESSGSYAQWAVNADVRENSSRLPVGREVADFEVTIVDPEGRPVEDGAIGEFIISSPYLALGYWRDPDLTQNVFSGHTLQTIKTGDLGRRRSDGLFEFVGRKDDQIKLHGRRIEIGDIEFALKSCSGVKNAAIVVRRNEAGLPRPNGPSRI